MLLYIGSNPFTPVYKILNSLGEKGKHDGLKIHSPY